MFERHRWMKLLVACGLSLCASGSVGAARGGLTILSERDMRSIKESGCEFGFGRSPRETLVFGLNNKIMIRVGTKASICPIDEGRFSAFAEGRGSLRCGGRSLTLRRVGHISSSMEADSAAFPAQLTVSGPGGTRKIRGTAGTAC